MQNHRRQREKRGHDVDWGATVTGAPASGAAYSTNSEPRPNSEIGAPSMAFEFGGSAPVAAAVLAAVSPGFQPHGLM